MDLGLSIDLNSHDLLQFLAQDHPGVMVRPPETPDGFVHDQRDRRVNPIAHESVVPVLVRELYDVVRDAPNGARTIEGSVSCIVAKNVTVVIALEHWLYHRSDLGAAEIDRLREFFNSAAPSGPDLGTWLAQNLPSEISQSDFCLRHQVTFTWKRSDVADASQRERLLHLFNRQAPTTPRDWVRNDDLRMGYWTQSFGLFLQQTGAVLALPDPPLPPEAAAQVVECAGSVALSQVLDGIATIVVPTSCGPSMRESEQVAEVQGWPEFMLDWVQVSFTVGCITVTLTLPVLRTRSTTWKLFVVVWMPSNLAFTLRQIAVPCAVRSALQASVVAVFVGNPGAAIAAFPRLFINCMAKEMVNCINPALAIVKEHTAWV